MDMAMVIMDIMARDLLMLSQLLLLSLDMDMVMDMAMDILAMDMEAMDTMDIMARGPLRLSLDMDIMVMDMVMDTDMDMMAMDMDTMDMVMVMAMDTTVKLISCLLVEFSTNEVGPIRSSQKTHTFN